MTAAVVPFLALTSALVSAGATVLLRHGLRYDSAYTAVWINVAVGVAGAWIAVVFTGGLGQFSLNALAYFAAAGLIGTVGGRLLRFMAIDLVGASISAALMNLSPLVSTTLAIVLLGERVTPPVLTGTLVIVVGTTLLSSGGRRIGVRPRLLIVPLLSAVCFGVVAILRKVGLVGMEPIPGFAINVTAALVAFTAFLVAARQTRAMTCKREGLVYLLAAGVAENLSVFLLLMALTVGAVSVVAPLASVSPIFVLVLSVFFLRGIEILNARIVTGILFIVAGIVLITALR